MFLNFQAVVLDFKGFSGDDGHHIPVFDVMVDKVEVIAAQDEFGRFVLAAEVEAEGLVLDLVVFSEGYEDLIEVGDFGGVH